MPEAKTKPTEISVATFLDSAQPEARRAEGRVLDALFQRITGWQPKIWGPSIVGYGRYRYTYASGHSGEAPATGFSPRKAELVIYVMVGYADVGPELARLGRHRLGKSCLYVRRLSDIDLDVLELILKRGLDSLGAKWPVDAG